MGVSKVTLNGVTLMDVTDKTVDTDNLLAGNSALRNDGESITGAVVTASPSDASPVMDGTASAGVATTYSRGDHVHPSDTNKANINNPSFTGTPTAPTALKGTNTTQIATTAFVQSAITDINYPVTSVNAKTGAVVLTANDVNALPDDTEIPTKTSDLTNDSNFVSDANYVHTDNNFTGTLKTKLEGIAEGAEVNQNAFSNVKVGTSTIAADTKTDTLTLTAGSNITLTPDTTNDAVTIAATVPTKVSDLTNDSNFITAAEAPVQSVNSKTGAVTLTASDVSALPSTTDVTKWNGVALDKSGTISSGSMYLPARASTSATTAYQIKATITPESQKIAMYNSDSYLNSTTPAANDNSTKVATTAYVDSAISGLGSILNYKGTKATESALPSTGNETGDVWIVSADNSEYVWNGTTWEKLGPTIDLSGYVPTTRTVNGKALSTDISLDASDVGALPDSTVIPDISGKVNKSGDTMTGNLIFNSDAKIRLKYGSNSTYTDIGATGNNGGTTIIGFTSNLTNNKVILNNIAAPTDTYHAANKKYVDDKVAAITVPVTSVNSKTGAVVLTAADVGALPDTTTIPTSTSDLTNDSGFITSSDIPVISVNNKTGAVSLTASDIGALPSSTDLSVYMQKGVDYVTAGKKTDTTLGTRATAEGQNNTASGNYSHAEGYLTTASGSHTHTEGQGTTASGQYGAHAEGQATTASGSYGSHAEGSYTTASSSSSHAEGQFSSSIGSQAHSEGYATLARGTAAHSEGSYTRAYGNQAHAEGIGTNASASYSHAEGSGTYYTIHVTAGQSEKEYNIIEDNIYIPYGANYSNFGIMDFTYAKKWYLVTGTSTQGTDPQKKLTSITLDEALSSSVIQNNAPLTLVLSGAVHNYSHVEGQSNISGSPAQHVGGKFNVVTSGAEVIGGGTSNTERANIRTLDWSGNEVLAGKLTVGAGPTNNMDVATKGYVDSKEVPPEIFWITVTQSDSTYTSDKTFTEIKAAHDDGKLCLMIDPSGGVERIFRLHYVSSSELSFTRSGKTANGPFIQDMTMGTDNSWTLVTQYAQNRITASGLLKGDGSGGVTTATASDIPSLNYVSKVTSTDNAVAKFNGTGGAIQNSGVTIDDNDVLLASAIGTSTNTYIGFPEGGGFRTAGSTQTGYLKITLPQSWTDTMMSFKVQMYQYNQNTSCEFTIGGYNYASGSGTWTNRPFAYSIGKSDVQTYSNLTVRLGHDGTKCAVYIGEANTSWQYMQIQVHDVLVGYKNYEYNKWATGWSVGFTTTLGTVTATITNPCVSYYAATAGTATSATSATSATTATTASASGALNFVHTNELLLGNTNSQTRVWINYRRVSGGATSGNTAITEYHFGNGNAETTGVTLYAANFSGVAAKATAANVTTTANALAVYSDTTGTFSGKASGNGALYATAANGAWSVGTLPAAQGGTGNTSLQATRNAMGLGNTTGALPVANGGTGAASFTANCVIMSNTTTTGALTTRAVTNNTSATALAANTNIPTQNTVYYGLNHRLNRTTALNAADTGYTTIMARGMGLRNADTNPSLNGAINWTYG